MNKILTALILLPVLCLFAGCGTKLITPIHIGSPVIEMDVNYLMAGEHYHLDIFNDGNMIFQEETRLRMPSHNYPPLRTWREGKLRGEDLVSLEILAETGGFAALNDYYSYVSESNHPVIVGDETITYTINERNLQKTVVADGYLSHYNRAVIPDLPHPLDVLYQLTWAVAQSTNAVGTEEIKN